MFGKIGSDRFVIIGLSRIGNDRLGGEIGFEVSSGEHNKNAI
jgi:hypothetical protein